MDFEELSEQLNSALNVEESTLTVKENYDNPRLYMYKNKGKAADQERRWRQQLSALRSKENRSNKFDASRMLDNNPWSTKSNHVISSWRSYSRHLMLAEWFLFMPPDFETDYIIKLCPKGRHVLVKARKGKTNIYSRAGQLLFSTYSRLPGGGLGQSEHHNNNYYTLLDCILKSIPNKNIQSLEDPMSNFHELYVLDLISLRSTDYTDRPFHERCMWLEDYSRQLIEEYETNDPIRFFVITSYQCNKESLQSIFSKKPIFKIDGVLLYHREVNYEPGPSPLVGWLKPYMLPEWFPNFELHPDFMLDIPEDYINNMDEIKNLENINKWKTFNEMKENSKTE